MDDAPRPERPKTSTATAIFIIETMTKNLTTRGWSCAGIVAAVSNTPGRQPENIDLDRFLLQHPFP